MDKTAESNELSEEISDKEYLQIHLISEAGYCMRRAALIMNEQVWFDSVDTVKGTIEHGNVHDRHIERRQNQVKLYEYDVVSEKLSVTGKCDCVEAIRNDSDGCIIPAADFAVELFPVEFKHGKVRDETEYNLQLAAQAVCLEEMYNTHISSGDIFYITTHKRFTVDINQELRNKLFSVIEQLQEIRQDFTIPPAVYSKKCLRCSLKEYCMPKAKSSAAQYCNNVKKEACELEND